MIFVSLQVEDPATDRIAKGNQLVVNATETANYSCVAKNTVDTGNKQDRSKKATITVKRQYILCLAVYCARLFIICVESCCIQQLAQH